MPFWTEVGIETVDAIEAGTTATEATTAAETAAAVEAANAANAAATANELSMASSGGGSGLSAIGGEGAGGAGINTAQVNAQQAMAQQVANSGITQAPLNTATEFSTELPANYTGNEVSSLTRSVGPGTQVAGPATLPEAATTTPLNPTGQVQGATFDYWTSPNAINGSYVPGDPLNPSGIVQSGVSNYWTPPADLEAGQTFDSAGNVVQSGSAAASNAAPGLAPETAPPSSWENGWNKFAEFADKHPYITGGALYTGAYSTGLLDPRQANFNNDPYKGPLNKYKLASNFQGNHPNTQTYQYAPRYAGGGILDAAGGGPVEQMSNNAAIGANTNYPMANMTTSAFSTPYQSPHPTSVLAPAGDSDVNSQTGELNPQGTRLASGGIASFSGGGMSSTLDYYTNMMEGPAAHQIAAANTPAAGSHDVGIVRDADPDTMYLTAPEAAQVRMGKIDARSNMQGRTIPRMGHLGTLNLKPGGGDGKDKQPSSNVEMAAQGGIMQASGHLGGYAAGGQPRLLKGPGDGMSDNIPATISGKQPARLADGEFVVPADVVSHLGNGSTDAGAKRLHEMMTDVRKARTGNPKQGKQINPNKYMPK